MPRNPMQDIVPKGRSIRNVPLSAVRSRADIRKEEKVIVKKEKELEKDISMKQEAETRLEEDVRLEKRELEESAEELEALRQAKSEFEAIHSKRRRNRPFWQNKKFYIPLAVIIIGLVAFLVAGALHSATITVTPRTEAVSVDADYIAKKNATTGLAFKLLSISETASETVRATGERQVTKRASGTITVFNNYSSTAQRLVKNTRFATPEGLIFRIENSITVPGKKGTTPGSVDAVVVADEAGEEYNVGLKDFTIPGFKGDPRYSSFYARSKTSIAGGFVGKEPVVSETDRAKAKTNIEAKLKEALIKNVATQISPDDIMLQNAYTIEFKALPDQIASAGEATIRETGTLHAALFDRKVISSAMADTYVKDYKDEPVLASKFDGLVFEPKDFHPGEAETIAFHLKGGVSINWLYNASTLKQALINKSRSEVPSVLSKFPEIRKADISIRPFWSGSFPGTVERITVR